MGIFAQIMSIVIVVLGIPYGMIVGWIARDELKEGKEYFVLIKELLFGLVFFFLLYHHSLPVIGVLAGAAAFALFSRFRKLRRGYIVYLVFLVILLLSEFDVLITSLMFIYGIPYGSILYLKYKSKIRRLLKRK